MELRNSSKRISNEEIIESESDTDISDDDMDYEEEDDDQMIEELYDQLCLRGANKLAPKLELIQLLLDSKFELESLQKMVNPIRDLEEQQEDTIIELFYDKRLYSYLIKCSLISILLTWYLMHLYYFLYFS